MLAVRLVYEEGWSIRKVARHTGFHHTAIMRWIKKDCGYGRRLIPTESSRPHHHPRELSKELVETIVAERMKRNRCAEHVFQSLKKQGVAVSMSSVKRTLDRNGLLKKRSPWKRRHDSMPRPEAKSPGDLMQIDTIQIRSPKGKRVYIYTMIDLCSRWAYAKATTRINTHESVRFLNEARATAPFKFRVIQTDHGSEFSTWFTLQLRILAIPHRHSRVRQSNDNAHVERFNRTLQEECLDHIYPDLRAFQKALTAYLNYYNGERLHMGINYKTPLEVVPSY